MIEELVERVDSNISKLIAVKDEKPGTEVNLPEEELVWISRTAREVFMDQPMLLEIDAPINICGDTHGQFHDLLALLDMGGYPLQANYLFLGDYVDRAKQSIETIALLLCYKIRYRESFFLLRGNHECAALNRIYGFFDECKRRYSVKLWRIFGDCFNCMPIAAIIADKVMCMHGGLSPDLEDLGQITSIQRPCEVPEDGLICDLVWSDPDPQIVGWGYNSRGVSYTFGPDVIRDFLQTHDLELICRAHQVVEDGYEFQAHRALVTIFSAPNYCGEFDNAAGIMCIDPNLRCSFKILRPVLPQPKPDVHDQSEKEEEEEGKQSDAHFLDNNNDGPVYRPGEATANASLPSRFEEDFEQQLSSSRSDPTDTLSQEEQRLTLN